MPMAAEGLNSLSKVKVLSELTPESLLALEQECRWRDYGPNHEVVAYHDTSNDVYFLTAGKARAVIYSASGKAVDLVHLEPGDMFGEIAAIDGRSRSASVETIVPSTVASLSAPSFRAFLLREPTVTMAVLRDVIGMVRRLTSRVYEFSTLTVEDRVHAELLRLAWSQEPGCSNVLLSPAPTLADIANRISTHREAVSRELSRLARLGILERRGADLWIGNVDRLAELVHEATRE